MNGAPQKWMIFLEHQFASFYSIDKSLDYRAKSQGVFEMSGWPSNDLMVIPAHPVVKRAWRHCKAPKPDIVTVTTILSLRNMYFFFRTPVRLSA